MSKPSLTGLQKWILASITITTAIITNSGVTALPQSAGNIPDSNNGGNNNNNDDINGDNSIVLQINENPLTLPLDMGKQVMRPRGVNDANAAIETMNYFFGERPIMIHQAKILQVPERYGCFFWTPEDTAATISYPASGPYKLSLPLSSPLSTPSSSSSMPSGASSAVKFVSETFYSDSVGITANNAFLDANFLTCFPTANMQGSIPDPDSGGSGSDSGSVSDTVPDQDTYETVALFLDIVSPMNINSEINPNTGNMVNLQAPFVPIRLDPVQARSSTGITDSDAEVSPIGEIDDNDIDENEEQGGKAERRLKVGYSPFPQTSVVMRSAIVHSTNPNVRCRVTGQDVDGKDTSIVFSAKTPLQQPVSGASYVMCFGR